MKEVGKKGQVTIFIIIAVAVVGVAIALYFLIPSIRTTGGSVDQNPEAFIEQCLHSDFQDAVKTISLQGGSLEPESYFTYNDVNIQYLCYTNEDLKTCVVQKPLLRQDIESELESEISPLVEKCFSLLKQNYEGKGYTTDLKSGKTSITILPNKVSADFDYIFTITKGETERYDSFDIVLDNNLYQFLSITKSIVEWEATLGDADPSRYMAFYPGLKVEKNLRDDGTRIYTLTERNTGYIFQFAVRSFVFPPGY